MKPSWITLLAGMGLIVPAMAGLALPWSAFVIIPGFFLYSWHLTFFTLAIPTLLFFAWNPALFRGRNEMPRRTYGLYIALVVLSTAWFVSVWKDGVQFQGKQYTVAVCAFGAIWAAVLGVILWRYRRTNRSFAYNLAVHWALFAWLAWCAFPYLGELP
jgi:hypothetical protein